MEIKVEGMKCKGCEARICGVLKEIDGIKKVKASFKKGIVSIKASKDVDINIIKDKINNLGFTVIED